MLLRCFPRDQGHGRDSFKPAISRHAQMVKDRGIGNEKYEHFEKHNWCVLTGVISGSSLSLIEEYVETKKRDGSFSQQPMFRHIRDGKVSHDEKRRMHDCVLDWLLYNLIRVPIMLALAQIGLLMVVGSVIGRVAQVVAHIESTGGGGNQSFHSDFDTSLAALWGDEWGFSVIVSTHDDCEVDIISNTWGGETDDDIRNLAASGHVKKVKLERGSCLIMGPGLVHRGVAYVTHNVRLFLAFLCGKSLEADFSHTYGLDDIRDEQEKAKIFEKHLVVVKEG